MMDACRNIARSFYVQGYKVTAIFLIVVGKPVETTFEWDPMPPRKRLTHRFIVEYRKKRDAVMKVVADELGGAIAMVDCLERRSLITMVQPGDGETIKKYLGDGH